MADEEFFAWLDGELAPAEAARVADAVANDPELQARAEAHRALQASLAAAFAPILTAPVPAALAAPIQPGAQIIDFAQARAARLPRAVPVWRQWAALAATLCVGVSIGLLAPNNEGPVARHGDRLVAGTSLDRALSTQLASAAAPSGLRIGLTFQAQDGAICRSFTDRAATGLACRQGEDWVVKGLFGAPAKSGDYRMAAGDDPALAALIDATIAGEPFDAAQERAARDRKWR